MEDLKLKFEELHKASQAKSASLSAEERGDDASLEKIRGNMYDIARQVFQAACKMHADEEKALGFLSQRLESFVTIWEGALNDARSRGDTVREVQEQIKVDTMREICEIVRAKAGDAQ